jgi:hypothetical protein
MAGRKKLSLREIREQHAAEIDVTDPRQRMRYRRTLDNLYAAGLKLEDPGISDVARGSAVKAAIDYADRTGGKAITPMEVTGTITTQTTEEHVKSILETVHMLKKAKEQPKPETVN